MLLLLWLPKVWVWILNNAALICRAVTSSFSLLEEARELVQMCATAFSSCHPFQPFLVQRHMSYREQTSKSGSFVPFKMCFHFKTEPYFAELNTGTALWHTGYPLKIVMTTDAVMDIWPFSLSGHVSKYLNHVEPCIYLPDFMLVLCIAQGLWLLCDV